MPDPGGINSRSLPLGVSAHLLSKNETMKEYLLDLAYRIIFLDPSEVIVTGMGVK